MKKYEKSLKKFKKDKKAAPERDLITLIKLIGVWYILSLQWEKIKKTIMRIVALTLQAKVMLLIFCV